MARKRTKNIKLIYQFSAFTQGGATKLALFYKSIGKKLLTNPTLNPQTSLWEITLAKLIRKSAGVPR